MSSTLMRRIANCGTNHQQVMGDFHPYGTEATPMVMTMPRVQVTAGGIAVDQLEPLYAAGPTRAPIAATAPGQWQQLYAAGRP
jgi:hypothetical protein